MSIHHPPKNTKLVVRRWGSAPLDFSPQPQPYLIDADPAPSPCRSRINSVNSEGDITEGEDWRQDEECPLGESSSEDNQKVADGSNKEDTESNENDVDVTPEKGRGCGRGIARDFRSTILTWWCAEMTNFNAKTVAVTIFLFFACIAPAITFGAIYGKATENRIGAVEMMIATAWVGIVYSLIGGQPMMINGGTGPVLAFTEIIFQMSQSFDVPFLTFNAWIGIWVAFYMLLAAFGSLNRIIRYATRFTDEIFALLIAAIFILNALGSPFSPTGLYYYFEGDHKSHEMHQDNDDYSHTAVALLSLLVSIGTVEIAFFLRRTKFSPFLPNQFLRDTVTDFAVVTAIVVWTLVANFALGYIPLEQLNVPSSISPTFACCTEDCVSSWPLDCPDLVEPACRRNWLVDLGDLNGKTWVPFMAAGPAALAFILVFLDDGITWHLINHPAYKLSHGTAYDYDTVIIGLMTAINSLFGLPVLVAATVRSQNHVHALAEKDQHGKILSVQQTRLTSFFIHVLCLVALFCLPVLQLIPMPVLYGVFLFMGLVSLSANTLWGRFLMFFMQPSKYPLEPWTMYMKPRRMHLFTIIQLGLFALLYAIKSIKSVAIVFPVIIALCIPIRLFMLPKIFTEKELVMIDGDDAQIKEWIRKNGGGACGEGKQNGDEGEGKLLNGPDETKHTDETKHSDDANMVKGNDGDVTEDKSAVIAAASQVTLVEEEMGDIESGRGLDADLALPLPDTTKRNRKHRNRKREKSLSCPTPHLLFLDEAVTPTIALEIPHKESALIVSSDTASASSDEQLLHEFSIPVGESMPRPRRRRQKALSCPMHILSHEADRHIAENYFFG